MNLRSIASAALAEDAAANRGGAAPSAPSNPDFESKHPRGQPVNKGRFRISDKTVAKLDDADLSVGDIPSPRLLRRQIHRSDLPQSTKAQMLAILKAYTLRGQAYKKGFLKSPLDMSQTSALSPMDWLLVRTDDFRNGDFGDWINLLRQRQLSDSSAVPIRKTGIAFTRPNGSYIKQAVDWINAEGAKVFDTEVGSITFDGKSVKDSLEHFPFTPAKYDALFSIPQGFPSAVYLGTMDDFDGNTITNHYFAYTAVYEGQRQIVFCRARENADRSALYIHDIFTEDDIKKEASVLPPDITALKAEIAQGVYRGSLLYNSILKLVYAVNPDSVSKNVDANGEPEQAPVDEFIAKNKPKNIAEDCAPNPDGRTAFGQSPAPSFNPRAFARYLATS